MVLLMAAASIVSARESFTFRKTVCSRTLGRGICIGSSHGWLVVLDETANPFLLNPFSCIRILLPPLETLPDVVSSSESEPRGITVLLGFWVMRRGMIFIIFASLQLVEEGITEQSHNRLAMFSSLTTRLVVYSARQATPMALR
ncbi:hypothetical protein WN943_027281 [Citrus x changshan-huyou]